LETCLEFGLDPFVTGFAHEAIARAAAEVDDVETFTEHLQSARALLEEIEDDEEREVLAADLAEMSERRPGWPHPRRSARYRSGPTSRPASSASSPTPCTRPRSPTPGPEPSWTGQAPRWVCVSSTPTAGWSPMWGCSCVTPCTTSSP